MSIVLLTSGRTHTYDKEDSQSKNKYIYIYSQKCPKYSLVILQSMKNIIWRYLEHKAAERLGILKITWTTNVDPKDNRRIILSVPRFLSSKKENQFFSKSARSMDVCDSADVWKYQCKHQTVAVASDNTGIAQARVASASTPIKARSRYTFIRQPYTDDV